MLLSRVRSSLFSSVSFVPHLFQCLDRRMLRAATNRFNLPRPSELESTRIEMVRYKYRQPLFGRIRNRIYLSLDKAGRTPVLRICCQSWVCSRIRRFRGQSETNSLAGARIGPASGEASWRILALTHEQTLTNHAQAKHGNSN